MRFAAQSESIAVCPLFYSAKYKIANASRRVIPAGVFLFSDAAAERRGGFFHTAINAVRSKKKRTGKGADVSDRPHR